MSAARRSTLAALAALVALAIPGSPTADSEPAPSRAAGSPALSTVVAALRVSPQAPELKTRPALVGRLRDTPRGYFRFVSRPFTQAVCALFRDARGGFPDVNLHGDAHLEQYAVTSLGRGLTDFDESARGPSFIDLVRFGVSLELAAREKDWPGEGRRAFGAFLGGYREALKDPDINSPAPPVVTRARGAFARDHRMALGRADAIIDADPVPASEIEAGSRDYVTQMLADGAGMPATFFSIKKAGRSTLGIGSALDEKYLLRIEGWSKEADDDQILEAKLVRPLSDVECVRTEQGPERVPIGMALIAYAPFPFSGLFTHRGRTFWVHGWTDDYMELSIDSSFASPQDLRQVAYDVGIQLGWAHPKEVPGKDFRPGLRGILLQATRKNEGRIRETIDDLAKATVGAWMAFREATGSQRSSKGFPIAPAAIQDQDHKSSGCDQLSQRRTPVNLKTTSSSLTAGFFVSVPYDGAKRTRSATATTISALGRRISDSFHKCRGSPTMWCECWPGSAPGILRANSD